CILITAILRPRLPPPERAKQCQTPRLQFALRMRKKQERKTGWGGRRRGSGRPKSGRRVGVPHRKRPNHRRRFPVHVTFRTRSNVPWLRGKVFRTVRRSLLRSQKPFFRVVEFSVQGTHVHLIVEANGRRALERGMRGLGTRVAMAINRASGRRGRVLADRYFARELRTTVHVRMALAYVLNNHRKH